MNGFRITILTLLCLSVGLMFYTVLFVIPDWQEQHRAYQSSLRIEEYQKKNDIHRRQMVVFDPSYEVPEVEQARLGAEEAVRRGEQTLNDAEESNVLAAARRNEEAARRQAQREQEAQQQEQDEVTSSPVIGLVASYDKQFNFIMIRPAVPQAFLPGAELAVRRNGRVVCEAVVDNTDTESGQVSATVRLATMPDNVIPESELEPIAGDEVIPSPFPSSAELRGDAAQPAAAAGAPAEALPTYWNHTEPASTAPLPAATPAQPSAEQPAAEITLPAAPEAAAPALPEAAAPSPAPAVPEAPAPASNKSLPSLDALLQPSLF